jgi:hypothetical protein
MSQLLLLDFIAPPVMAGIWRLMAGGWAMGVQGSKVSDQTKSRQRSGFWALLCFLYVMAFAFTVYDWLT